MAGHGTRQGQGRPGVDARPGRLTAGIPSPGARLQLSVTTDHDDAAVVTYTDPRGGTRTVSHAALASVELTLHRPGHRELSLSSGQERSFGLDTGGWRRYRLHTATLIMSARSQRKPRSES
jgi:hypothetical protein